ncbi:MAG TPA: AI-2E family transporter [Ktedonobacterales bacterium]|nr:AI-2E family transporter [Ktedonobacterales bacterium]
MDNSRGVLRRPNRAPSSTTDAWAWRRDVAWAILGWGAIVAVGLWLAGHFTRTLLIVAIAALLAYALAPVVSVLHRVIPRWAAVTLVYVGLMGLLVAVSSLMVASVATQVAQLANQIAAAFSPSRPGGAAPLFEALQRLGVTSSQIAAARDFATTQITDAASGVAPLLTEALTAAFDVLVVIVLSIYLSMDGGRIVTWLRTGLPRSQRTRGMFVADTIERVAGGYIRGQLVMCLAIGALVGVGLWVMGVPFAALIGVLAFFLEFVPFIGPPIAAAFAVLLAWPLGLLTIALVLGWFVLIHILEGYILQPRLVGHFVGLHPAVTILAVLAAGEVFGLWGALFAAPVFGIGQALLVGVWHSWKERHPDEFPPEEMPKDDAKPAAPKDTEAEETARA